MAKKAIGPNPFTGRWRIVSMSAWDEDYIDKGKKSISSSIRRASASSISVTSTATRIAD